MSKRWLRVFAAVLVLGCAGVGVTWLERRDDRPPVHVALVGPITGSNPENGEAVLVKVVRHHAHLHRGTGEAVDEQHPDGPTLKIERRWI